MPLKFKQGSYNHKVLSFANTFVDTDQCEKYVWMLTVFSDKKEFTFLYDSISWTVVHIDSKPVNVPNTENSSVFFLVEF